MKDGNYDVCFSADGHTSRGSLVVDGERATAVDGQVRLDGNLFERTPHITAIFNVLTRPRLVRNALIPAHYSLQLIGTGNDAEFNLIGTGPLGLIVEISCSYAGPLTDAQRVES
jgi:hypothetical protein